MTEHKTGLTRRRVLARGGIDRRPGVWQAGHHRLSVRPCRGAGDAADRRHRRQPVQGAGRQVQKRNSASPIQYTSLVSDDVVKRAVTQPSSFDLLDSEYWMLKKIVPSGNLRGIDIKKIKYYDQIVPIFTKGKLPDGKPVAMEGISPIKVAYLAAEKSKEFSKGPSQWMTVIPTVYNADTLGIRPDLIKRADQLLGRAARPRIQGQGGDPRHPVDRHHGCGDGVRGDRQSEICRQGQHDDRRDRPDDRGHDRG